MLATLPNPSKLSINSDAPHGTGLGTSPATADHVPHGKPPPGFLFPSFFPDAVVRLPSLTMDIYLFTLTLSFSGLVLMAVAGLGHHHHAAGKTTVPRGHGAHPHGPRPGKLPGGGRGGFGALLLGLFSPRVFLSILLGFGATGLFLRPLAHWPAALLFVLAAIGGWGFERLLIAPMWQFIFGFASRPAETLDTLAASEGEAATDFDAEGHGLIAVQLDGQVRQVLGTLPLEERAPGSPRVRTGERLFIRAVNRQRNTCTVSRLGC